jgi:hypothetical protein
MDHYYLIFLIILIKINIEFLKNILQGKLQGFRNNPFKHVRQFVLRFSSQVKQFCSHNKHDPSFKKEFLPHI